MHNCIFGLRLQLRLGFPHNAYHGGNSIRPSGEHEPHGGGPLECPSPGAGTVVPVMLRGPVPTRSWNTPGGWSPDTPTNHRPLSVVVDAAGPRLALQAQLLSNCWRAVCQHKIAPPNLDYALTDVLVLRVQRAVWLCANCVDNVRVSCPWLEVPHSHCSASLCPKLLTAYDGGKPMHITACVTPLTHRWWAGTPCWCLLRPVVLCVFVCGQQGPPEFIATQSSKARKVSSTVVKPLV